MVESALYYMIAIVAYDWFYGSAMKLRFLCIESSVDLVLP